MFVGIGVHDVDCAVRIVYLSGHRVKTSNYCYLIFSVVLFLYQFIIIVPVLLLELYFLTIAVLVLVLVQ